MNRQISTSLSFVFILGFSMPVSTIAAPKTATTAPPIAQANMASVEKVIAAWAERPRLGARQMLAKYGLPHEVTSKQLVWHKAGPFKRITVLNLETPHDFPLPHVDYMEHTIDYNVPQEKVADLIRFDASSTINRTVGELSARCDLEGHNILTLNLDHDIVTGKKTVEEARRAFGEIVQQDVTAKHPPYVEALQFQPAGPSAGSFSDVPVIPGSPVRLADVSTDRKGTNAEGKMPDAEVLSTVIAVDLNEVLAAAEASKKRISAAVLEYAKMLHAAHGENMVKGMKLGQQMSILPVDTLTVDKLKVKGAGELASIVKLDGAAFEKAYVAMMIKGHGEVIAMIDSKLLKAVQGAPLKAHLTETRAHVVAHLDQAQKLQATMK
jgi:predicted outer membrane protein